MAAFSYVSPLIGTNVAGRLADKHPVRTFLAAAVGSALVPLLIVATASSPIMAVILMVLLGVTGMAVPPVATGLAVQYAAAAPTLAAALTVSAFNLGIALGSSVAGIALDSSLGATGPALIGVVAVCLGIPPLLVLLRSTQANHSQATPQS